MGLLKAAGITIRGVAAALRARWKLFAAVALGVFALNLFLPVAVLSLARKPVDAFTFNPWLSRLPEWLASGNVSISRKLEFLSTLALAWFSLAGEPSPSKLMLRRCRAAFGNVDWDAKAERGNGRHELAEPSS